MAISMSCAHIEHLIVGKKLDILESAIFDYIPYAKTNGTPPLSLSLNTMELCGVLALLTGKGFLRAFRPWLPWLPKNLIGRYQSDTRDEFNRAGQLPRDSIWIRFGFDSKILRGVRMDVLRF